MSDKLKAVDCQELVRELLDMDGKLGAVDEDYLRLPRTFIVQAFADTLREILSTDGTSEAVQNEIVRKFMQQSARTSSGYLSAMDEMIEDGLLAPGLDHLETFVNLEEAEDPVLSGTSAFRPRTV